jgi:hypothetical protein
MMAATKLKSNRYYDRLGEKARPGDGLFYHCWFAIIRQTLAHMIYV